MTRMSRVDKIRNVSPRRPKVGGKKTGPRKDTLSTGYKVHANALQGSALADKVYIPKVKGV